MTTNSKQVLLTSILLTFTFFSILIFYQQIAVILSQTLNGATSLSTVFTIVLFIIISFFILYGNILYHLTRIGYYLRLNKHEKVTRKTLNSFLLSNNLPTVTYLIPAYKEEPKTILLTLWSAALQNYIKQRIVLLIDNPPSPKQSNDKKLLLATRKITIKMQAQFDDMKKISQKEFSAFNTNSTGTSFDISQEIDRLAKLYDSLHLWLEKSLLQEIEDDSHVDAFFFENIYTSWIDVFKQESRNWKKAKKLDQVTQEITHHYIRIIGMLDVSFSNFERKKYSNLNHEPNKAMNINSYLHLLGKRVRKFDVHGEKYLEVTKDLAAQELFPDSDYVLNLDADSILLPDYTVKLVYEMEKKKNKKVAVIQTPYSAYPGAKSRVERIAGATTDIQYSIHQGFTYYNATYWVGANAMLRKAALEDLKLFEVSGDKVSPKYIQDRTVIEDTESSIDLVKKGWKLLNYPERLAYSSTPPDFGSLIIQRQRWANGGLIIFPKLVKYLLRRPFSFKRWVEFIVRANYLTSIAGVNIGTLVLLLYPFSDAVFSWWLPLASIPYYFLYTLDLKSMGYRLSDVLRVYALNLILIPINIAGVLKSMEQGYTGKKIPFKRTPKIGNRVVAEFKFILFQYFLLFFLGLAFIFDVYYQQWTHATFSLLNLVILLYAVIAFIGVSESWKDLRSQLVKGN